MEDKIERDLGLTDSSSTQNGNDDVHLNPIVLLTDEIIRAPLDRLINSEHLQFPTDPLNPTKHFTLHSSFTRRHHDHLAEVRKGDQRTGMLGNLGVSAIHGLGTDDTQCPHQLTFLRLHSVRQTMRLRPRGPARRRPGNSSHHSSLPRQTVKTW